MARKRRGPGHLYRLVPPSYPEGFDELFHVRVGSDSTFEIIPYTADAGKEPDG